MTTKEFNEKYKDYLEEGYYGLTIEEPRVILFLNTIFKDLTKISGFKYYQIKSKFGTARVYTNLENLTEGIIEDRINSILNG